MIELDPDTQTRAGELFIARAIESDVAPSPARISFGDIYAALTGGSPDLTPAQKRLVLINRRLRADLNAIRDELKAAGRATQLPALAAAASESIISERQFPGGSIRLAPVAARPGQVFLVVSSSDGSSEPSCIIAEAADGAFTVALPIDSAGVNGQTQILLDMTVDHHAFMARLLQDPGSNITIVWRA